MNGSPILFVGAGRIGKPIIRRMIAGGLDVRVSDANVQALDDLAREGVPIVPQADSSRLTFSRVVLCLPDPKDSAVTLAVWIQHGLPADTIIADLTTMSPSAARQHADVVARSGGIYLDCPVSGGQLGAQSGDIVLLAGGPQRAFEELLPILQVIAKTVHHTGEVGSASLAKAINQYVYLSYNLAFAYGLCLGHELGMPDAVIMDLLTKGAPAHPLINDRLPVTMAHDFREGFLLKRCLKDMDCLEAPGEAGGAARADHERVREEISRAVDEGLGDLDILALSRADAGRA